MNNSKSKIVVTVEGGVVQGVYSNTDAEVVVIDFDDESADLDTIFAAETENLDLLYFS